MLSQSFLQNTGAVRDLCQDICCELDELSNSEYLSNTDKKFLQEKYEKAKRNIEELTSIGYFNKSLLALDKKKALNLINEVVNIEEESSRFAKNIWACQIVKPKDFTQSNFKLCVKQLNCDLKNLEKTLVEALNSKSSFVACSLISNSNIVLPTNSYEDKSNGFGFGIVYDVKENSFVMASEESSICSIKQKDFEITSGRSVVFEDLKACIKGNAVKLKTPNKIIEKNLKNPLTKNNNVVILDAKISKPTAIFCYGCDIKKVNLLKRKLSFFAKKYNLPMININVLKHYQINKEYFTSNILSRKLFNIFVDSVLTDLQTYTKYDFKAGAKRLIGLNTNLRYNFLYKFAMNINRFLENKKEMTEQDIADYIVEMFLKSVEKHNVLTKKREKANGGPLFFPNEDTFIALPKDFLNIEV